MELSRRIVLCVCLSLIIISRNGMATTTTDDTETSTSSDQTDDGVATSATDVETSTSSDQTDDGVTGSGEQTTDGSLNTDSDGETVSSGSEGTTVDDNLVETTTETDECKSDPCKHGGTCEIKYPGGYECKCTEDFTGKNCEDNCKDVCGENAICNFDKDVPCTCKSGFQATSKDKNPIDCVKNICKANTCKNGGICSMKAEGKTQCNCSKTHTGDFCECKNIKCEVDSCLDGSTCKEGCTSFLCRCPKFQKYNYIDEKCETIDACKLGLVKCNETNQECVHNECQCKKGYKNSDNKLNCTDKFDICKDIAEPWPDNSKCVNAEPSYWFNCNDGFYNSLANGMSQNVTCTKIPCICKGNRVCNKDGKCECKEGFKGDDCEPDIGSCKEECKPNEVCVKVEQVDVCKCKAGFEMIEGNCADINECTDPYISSTCKPYGDCINIDGGYECDCGNNTRNETTKGCDPVDECKLESHDCNERSTDCIDLDKGYKCQCKNGFEEIPGNVSFCKAEDKCKSTPCGTDGRVKCVNNLASEDGYECVCPPNELFHKKNKNCIRNVVTYPGELKLKGDFVVELNDPKSDEFLRRKVEFERAMTSLLSTDKQVFVQVVQFKKGSVIVMFDVLSDPNQDIEDLKKVLHLQCNYFDDSNKSCSLVSKDAVLEIEEDFFSSSKPIIVKGVCPHRFIKEMCSADEATCISKNEDGKEFDCECHDGYENFGYGDVVKCKDIDECSRGTHNCNTTSKICENLQGSYTCKCGPGYMNVSDGCKGVCHEHNPCQHDGICKVLEASESDGKYYSCECKSGYVGDDCSIKRAALEGWKAGMGVAIAALIITMIISAVVISRLRKKAKHFKEYSKQNAENGYDRHSRNLQRN